MNTTGTSVLFLLLEPTKNINFVVCVGTGRSTKKLTLELCYFKCSNEL